MCAAALFLIQKAQAYMRPPPANILTITDIDDTIIKKHIYPIRGARSFLEALDMRGGSPGDTHAVSARELEGWLIDDTRDTIRRADIEYRSIWHGPYSNAELNSYSGEARNDFIQRGKIINILECLRRNPHSDVVLMGDTTQRDPHIYKKILEDDIRTYPDPKDRRIKLILIRKIKGREIPKELDLFNERYHRQYGDRILPVVHVSENYADAAVAAYDRGLMNAEDRDRICAEVNGARA
jgi:hypothetical protein